MSSDFLNQMQDVKSQMDQFRLYLQIQQERSSESQSGNSSKLSIKSGQHATPSRNFQSINRSRTTPKKPHQKKNPYTPIDLPTTSNTPKPKKKNNTANLLSTSDSSDDEINSLLKEHRKSSTSPSPFKKYHFSTDSKASLSKYSTSPEQSDKSDQKEVQITDSDSTEISKDEISFSDSNSDSFEHRSYRVTSARSDKSKSRHNEFSSDKYSHKMKIIHSMKLVDQVMSESDNKKKKKIQNKLKISKSFTVPYSGSYEEGEVLKIEDLIDNSSKENVFSISSDSEDDEFINNFVPPVADDIDEIQNPNNNENKKNGLNESQNTKNTEKSTQNENSAQEDVVVGDIPDVEIPKVDLNFLNDDDDDENKNSSSESDKETLNTLFNEVKTICTILDKEEEESN